jgi:hypothetical protein
MKSFFLIPNQFIKQASDGLVKVAVGNRAARKIIDIINEDPEAYDRIKNKPRWMSEYTLLGSTQLVQEPLLPRTKDSWYTHNKHKDYSANRKENLESIIYRRTRDFDRRARLYESPLLKQDEDTYHKALGKHEKHLAENPKKAIKINADIDETRNYLKNKAFFHPRFSVNLIPSNPEKYGFKGGDLGMFDKYKKDLFISGYAPVSAGYANASKVNVPVISRVKPHNLEGAWPDSSPSAAKWTPHLASLDKKRIDLTKKLADKPVIRTLVNILGAKIPKVISDDLPVYDSSREFSHARNKDWEKLRYYESVVDIKNPPRSFPINKDMVGVVIIPEKAREPLERLSENLSYLVSSTPAGESFSSAMNNKFLLPKEKFLERIRNIPKLESNKLPTKQKNKIPKVYTPARLENPSIKANNSGFIKKILSKIKIK